MATETDLPILMKPGDLADFLDVSRATLDRWRVTDGGPPFIRIGTGPNGRVRYRRDALVAWLRDKESAA